MRKTKWTISVRSLTGRKDFQFQTQGEEKPVDTYNRVKKAKQQLEAKLEGRNVSIDIISRTIPLKPKGHKPHSTYLWCPYCNTWRIFKYNEYLGCNNCCICGISDNDFYVKTYNRLWREGLTKKNKR